MHGGPAGTARRGNSAIILQRGTAAMAGLCSFYVVMDIATPGQYDVPVKYFDAPCAGARSHGCEKPKLRF